jgi:hypothetical protein
MEEGDDITPKEIRTWGLLVLGLLIFIGILLAIGVGMK